MNDPKHPFVEEVQALQRSQQELRNLLLEEQNTLRDLAQRLWSQQEAERARFSQELHDGVGQLLTALTRRLNLAASEYKEAPELADLAAQALADVRQLSRLMRPRILDDLGLAAALSWLVRSLCEHEPVEIDVQIDIQDEPENHLAILVFRIAQEALTNAVRHANATHISLYASRVGNTLRLDIIDDGHGFELKETTPGVGLASMRDRAAAFAAELEIQSRPGGGCHLSLLVLL
ncbi:two-component sensor histidine kinase [Aliidiomarina shirensis]|uniref:Two-component sensor histidine kinase n=1 Tax=Aliidiomarina shirensis TaxID=1048642 RepID=A0A432WT71_9GAMM|nr:sensor histidine kinase [Aliidiomarina shirensis]RUO36969.1 two-component sensor histidine kinase [Aliidiomarina shirensis]